MKPPAGRWPVNAWRRLRVTCGHGAFRRRPVAYGRMRPSGRLLRNPRIVGDRAYKGQVVARDCWPAILDRETFARLQLTLNHPGRQGAPPRHHKRLATGFAQCGLCGQNMATTTRSGVRYYSCPTQPTGCGRIHVHADRLEAWLLDQLLEQLRLEPPPTAQDADPGDTAAAMAELCRDYYVDRIVTRAAFLSARALLVRRADELSRQAGRRPEVARVLAAANPRKQLACARPRAAPRPAGRPPRPARGQPHDQAATWRVRCSPAPMRMEDAGAGSNVVANTRASGWWFASKARRLYRGTTGAVRSGV